MQQRRRKKHSRKKHREKHRGKKHRKNHGRRERNQKRADTVDKPSETSEPRAPAEPGFQHQ